MTDPVRRSIDTTRACIERIARDHTALTAHMAGYTISSTGPDPGGAVEWTTVEAAALRRIASQAGHYQNLIEVALRALLEADTIRALGVTATISTAQAVSETRCDGWDDPTCEDNGVQNVWIGGHNHWLCQRCWARQRKQKERASLSQNNTVVILPNT